MQESKGDQDCHQRFYGQAQLKLQHWLLLAGGVPDGVNGSGESGYNPNGFRLTASTQLIQSRESPCTILMLLEIDPVDAGSTGITGITLHPDRAMYLSEIVLTLIGVVGTGKMSGLLPE